ncbi:MAG: ABC transporter ATP-binding protein [Candidatus Binatia bacterium]
MTERNVILEAKELKKHFPLREGFFARATRFVRAVDGVSFSLYEGETMALVGESGCGKSTTGKLLLRLIEPTSGSVHFLGRDLINLDGRELLRVRQQLQIIFQDTLASLNPRKTIAQILRKPFHLSATTNENGDRQVPELLELVGLSPSHLYLNRHPHELSGGQRQRVGIARALALHPRVVVADEPVSALDMSVKAQILALMKRLQQQFKLSYLFITHDLSVARSLASEVGVMYLGLIVEKGPVQRLFSNPLHPYTQALLSSVPIPNPRVARSRQPIVLKGDLPSPIDPPTGCRFHTRCPFVMDRCREEDPLLKEKEEQHVVACFLHD